MEDQIKRVQKHVLQIVMSTGKPVFAIIYCYTNIAGKRFGIFWMKVISQQLCIFTQSKFPDLKKIDFLEFWTDNKFFVFVPVYLTWANIVSMTQYCDTRDSAKKTKN